VLGYAGDLTITGKREEVLVIREENGQRRTAMLDLTSIELLDSPYYFVKPNDVIIVKPNYAKLQSAGYLGKPTTLVTIASLLISTLTLLTN
jgi:polysaccharide export outer membrane protein